jgi:hypothetical protein
MGNQGGGLSVSARDARNIAKSVDKLTLARGAPSREELKNLSKALLSGQIKKPTKARP